MGTAWALTLRATSESRRTAYGVLWTDGADTLSVAGKRNAPHEKRTLELIERGWLQGVR
jgi:hypothetical protein